jgi:RNA polymerase sigma-70 factor, ECF subfamily
MNLEEKIEAAKQGDEAALGSLLEGYQKYLKLLAQVQIGRNLRSKVDASDVVQETFLEAHRGITRFQGTDETQLAAWLRAILAARLSNTLRHYIGTQARDVRMEQQMQQSIDRSAMSIGALFVDPHSSPSQHVVKNEQSRQIVNALAGLPEHYRDVLVLRHLEEKTFPEIATEMGRTVDSVEKLWVRGLTELRKQFSQAQ